MRHALCDSRPVSRARPFQACSTRPSRQARRIACSSSSSSSRRSGSPISAATAMPPAASNCLSARAETTPAQQQLALGVASAAAALLLTASPVLAFGPVSVKLNDLKVTQIECGAGVSTVGGVTFSGAKSQAACLEINAQAINPSAKPLYNLDVFGRVYDANDEAAIDDTENIRIAYIDEVPPGTSAVGFRLFVPMEQYKLGPLRLTGFKATGFPGKNLPKTTSSTIDAAAQADCEITGDCDDLAAEAAIR